jgi:outer membrane protein
LMEKYHPHENYRQITETDKMRLAKYFLTLLFLTACMMVHAQQQTLTLQQCLDIAIKNNLTVKQDSITAQADRINFLQAKDNLIPYISGGANRTFSSGRAVNPVTNTYVTQSVTSDNYNLNGSVTLFNGKAP